MLYDTPLNIKQRVKTMILAEISEKEMENMISTMKMMHEKKYTLSQISKALKATQQYTKDLMIEHGLMKKAIPRDPDLDRVVSWKTEEEYIFGQLKQGYSYGQIAERMGFKNKLNKAQGMGQYINRTYGSKEKFLGKYETTARVNDAKLQKQVELRKEEAREVARVQNELELSKKLALLSLLTHDHPELVAVSQRRVEAIMGCSNV